MDHRTRPALREQLPHRMCKHSAHPCDNLTFLLTRPPLSALSKQHIRYLELSLRYQDTILGHLFGVSRRLYGAVPDDEMKTVANRSLLLLLLRFPPLFSLPTSYLALSRSILQSRS